MPCEYFGPRSPRINWRHLLGSATAVPILVASILASPSRATATFAKTWPLRRVAGNRSPLAPQPCYLLPSGAVEADGWLKRQLRIQANGLSGHLDEIWPDVGPKSGWLGGAGESWERGPYYLDGLLPLAWQLNDDVLKAKARRFIEWTLVNARADGMFGPEGNDDWWPRMVMLKVFVQYFELTADQRVIEVMTRYFAMQLTTLPMRPLKDWGRFRWQYQLVTMIWLYNLTGDRRIISLASLLHDQGWNWSGYFADFPHHAKVTGASIGLGGADSTANGLKDLALSAHGVNIAMGVKATSVWSIISNDDRDRDAIHQQLSTLDHFHGQPTGIFAADEHLAGRSPSQGVELCAVVEMMYSLQQSLAINGSAAIADRLEMIAFNALPAALSDDMWAHQYDQQPNQVQSSLAAGPWTSNGPEANLFGLEPHFGCCTANFHQGWPKLVQSMWLATARDGLVAMVYGPCRVITRVRGVDVEIVESTDYPFDDVVQLAVSPAMATIFPIDFRVPGWAKGLEVTVNGRRHDRKAIAGFITINRKWTQGDRVELRFAVMPRQVKGSDGIVSIAHGPILFVLPIGEHWQKWRDRGQKAADWQVFPTTEWRYAMTDTSIGAPLRNAVPLVPFSRMAPAMKLAVAMRRLYAWPIIDGSAAPPPMPPKLVDTQPELVDLIPYGAAKLRITAFPVAGSEL